MIPSDASRRWRKSIASAWPRRCWPTCSRPRAASGALFVVAPGEPPLPEDVQRVADPRRGQGAAVRAALDAAVSAGAAAPYLVVNADLPCATPRDLLALVGAIPEGGLALAAAADGTTNALALVGRRAVRAALRPGQRRALRSARAGRAPVDAPNLVDDVDTLAI